MSTASEQLVAVDFDPFATPELADTAPTTEGQREIWVASQMGDIASAAFNESVSLTLSGALDVGAFQAALADLVARHESLRSTISSDGLTLCISAALEPPCLLSDLSQVPAREQPSRLRALQALEVQTPFRLELGPLFRTRLIKLNAQQHVAILSAHHIVCDGWSMAVMLSDLATLYSARVQAGAAALPEAHKFSVYARDERTFELSPKYAKDEAYWLSKLAGSLPVLELPLDGLRPPARSYNSLREDHVLDAALVQRLKKVGAQQGASFFTTMLSAFYALLGRLSGEQDLIIGIPAAGQSATDRKELVGHCVNTLPLRLQYDGTAKLSTFLKDVRAVMLDGYDHQRCTFGSIIKKLALPRDPSRVPLVPVLFNVDKAVDADKLAFAGLRASYASNPRSSESFELFINASESEGVVTLECQFNTDLFSQDTIRRWLGAYEQLLRGVAKGDDVAVGSLPLLAEQERAKLLYEWNATFTEYPRELSLHGLIEAQVARTPDAIALVFEDQSVSYAELERRANQLAHRLRSLGVGPKQLVGLCLRRSVELIVGLLGILKTGAAYVPLDPSFPSDRIAFMVEDAQLALLVSDQEHVRTLALQAPQLLCIDTEADAIAREPSTPLPRQLQFDDRAYVIYTSGSTGKPKGVAVPHGAVVNFLCAMAQEPGLVADDVLLAVTTLSFDIAVLELLLPFSVGARVILAPRETTLDGALLLAAIERHRVTVMQATPSTWRLLLGAGFSGGPHFKMLCGGEALPRDLVSELVARSGSLWNMYGPTETTVWSTCYRVSQPSAILIGKPIANTTVYVLDEHLAPVPIGVPGELHIGGDGVTNGYLGRESLTQQRFIRDPFASDPNARVYKTGDVVRYRSDGNLQYLRRNDQQVKVRGYRIELGEIEARLAAAPGVAQAAVVVRELHKGDVRLIGYFVPSGADAPREAALRTALRRDLPEYMLPQHYVQLSKFPLTPNNKLDRNALPLPDTDATSLSFVAPANAREASVVASFERVLGAKRVSSDANFFELGGHSILAAQLLNAIKREHGVTIPLRDLFESPTPTGLAKRLPANDVQLAAASTHLTIPRQPDGTPTWLSSMQQRLWILEQLDPGLAVYNLPSAFRIRGALDIEAFERALQEIAVRHESLRTVFREHDDAVAQIVEPSIVLALRPLVDLTTVPSAQRETALRKLLEAEAAKPFNLSVGPLVAAKLYKLADVEHVFFWNAHHMVWDGWSFDIFLHELDQLYGAFAAARPSPLAELPIRYRDFAHWQRAQLDGPELKRQADYWLQQLGGQLPVLELPTDHPRPAQLSYRGATEPFFMPKDEIDVLTALGRRSDATLYMVILAAFNVLLSRWTGQEDIIIGTPIRGRTAPETEDVIGFFVNTLVFRTNLSAQPSFASLLEQVRKVALDAYAHADMPFDVLVHELEVPRDLSRTPIFQAFFTYQDVSNREPKFGELSYSQVNVHAPVAPTDLYLWVKETGSGLTGGIDYATDLFDRATMTRFVGQLRQLLTAVSQDPALPISQVNILPDAERRAILTVNETQAPYPQHSLASWIAEQCQRTPDRIAVVSGSVSVTYAELHTRAMGLAHVLRELSVTPGSLVGICVERSPDMLVAMLATLQAGAGYVPLDPGFPADRLAYMISDSKLMVIVTQRDLQEDLPAHGAQVVLVDAPRETPNERSAGWEPSAAEDVVYAIYTSGSTGKPKGVAVPQRALINFLSSMGRSLALDENDSILAVTTLSFDIAALELWLPLTLGACIVLASREDAADGERLVSLVRQHRVSLLQATPATFRLLLAAGLEPGDLTHALVGGEALPRELARELSERVTVLRNMYGPTETTVWSTMSALHKPVERVTIGRPIDNTQVYVLDRNEQLCPVGVPGELWIGGDGVTLGYLGQPELTATRFRADRFRGQGLLYRTGDVVRMLPEGDLEYQRRNDHQVKVRGYRIELGEIELALASHPAVERALAMAREVAANDTRLVAYVIKRAEVTDSELRSHLRKSLPEYFLPQHFVELESFPLTLNGKVDRKALPPPGGEVEREEVFEAPSGPVEEMIAAAFRDALRVEAISAHDNFFGLGGHSLLALQVIARLQRECGVRISPRVMLLNSLRQIAAQLPQPQTLASTGAQAVNSSPQRQPTNDVSKAPDKRPRFGLRTLLSQAKRALRRGDDG
jgi:amino acid adenylation domain-containing protein